MVTECSVCAHTAAEGWDGLPTGSVHCGDSVRGGITGCHATWRGVNKQHTLCCHRTFSSPSAEERYHRDARGRCRTVEEMLEKGAVDRDGVWGRPDPPREAFGG